MRFRQYRIDYKVSIGPNYKVIRPNIDLDSKVQKQF